MSASTMVLLSGGQDSTVCLAWALERYCTVETIGFDYGQRHSVELQQRGKILSALAAGFPRWTDRLGAEGERKDAMAVDQDLTRLALIQAIDAALADNWQSAHAIVQQHEGDAMADWIHAVLHKIEGDASNSHYWYGQAGQRYEAYPDPKAELASIRATFGAG